MATQRITIAAGAVEAEGGPTPASWGEEIRPASAVTVFGRVVADPKVFKNVSSGTTVRVTQA